MSAPKVSIVVPVYNTQQYLGECIQSLQNQTISDIEIILVDDGSGEECARFCDELAQNDSRVKVIHQQNTGQGLARNAALEVALGDYVGFVDSDDYVDTAMYEALYQAAVKHDADLVLSGVSFVGGNTFRKDDDFEEKHYFNEETVFENARIKQLLLGVVGALPKEADDSRYGVSVWKNLFKRSLLMENNIRFLSERKVMSEDALFMVDYVKCIKKAVGIPGAFYRYRRNDASFSKAYKSDRLEKVLVFLEELEAHIKDAVTKEEYGLYLNRLVQGYARILCSQEIMYAYEQKLSYSHLKNRLKRICTNNVIAGALKIYPWHQLPKKQAAFAFAMKCRLYLLQKWMVILRAR